jgi:hypothetical protein
MKKIFGLGLIIFLHQIVFAQDGTLKDIKATATTAIKTTDDTTINKWLKGGTLNLSMTQVSNNNWVAAGGDKFSLSFSGIFHAFATKKWGNKTWDNILDLSYGLTNTTTLGVRKTNDLINFVSKYGITPTNWKNVNITLLGQFRSQLTNGYDYNYFGSGIQRRTSGFFAPAYITIAPGIDWRPNSWLSIFGSPAALRWTIVSNDPYSFAAPGGVFEGHRETPLATLYGVDSISENLAEIGAFVTISAKKDLMTNVNYYTKLDLYSNYLKNPQNIAVFWTNQFILKVNKWINVTYEIDLLDDDNIKQSSNPGSAVGLQVLSTLGVGFATKF